MKRCFTLLARKLQLKLHYYLELLEYKCERGREALVLCVVRGGWRPPYIGVERWFQGLLGTNSTSTAFAIAREDLVPKLGANRAFPGSAEPVGRPNQAWPTSPPPLAGGLLGFWGLLPWRVPLDLTLFTLWFGPLFFVRRTTCYSSCSSCTFACFPSICRFSSLKYLFHRYLWN